MDAALVLDDGTVLRGSGFGRPATVYGELVFNTGMVGYTETLTDPSYRGQILTLTYPLVGNYGVPDPGEADEDGIPRHFESDMIQARGLAVHELSASASHWNLSMTLDEWMHGQGVPGISGLDTRALTKRLREGGVMMAALAVSGKGGDGGRVDVDAVREGLAAAPRYGSEELVREVSTPSAVSYGVAAAVNAQAAPGRERPPSDSPRPQGQPPQAPPAAKGTVVVVDAGAKNAIVRSIRRLGYAAVKVPWDTPADAILSMNPSGVVISNGPGDPEQCGPTVETARALIERDVPTLGICLGAQIIGIAGGARTYKLKYGHRGQNKPCLNLDDGQVYVTSQNHGYCIDPDSLGGTDFRLWFSNTDDRTVEGIRHATRRCIAVQFHPEASPGPYDCRFIFERLGALIAMDGSSKGPAGAAGTG